MQTCNGNPVTIHTFKNLCPRILEIQDQCLLVLVSKPSCYLLKGLLKKVYIILTEIQISLYIILGFLMIDNVGGISKTQKTT